MQESFVKQEGAGTNPTSSPNTSAIQSTSPNDVSMKKQKTLEDYELVNQPNKTNPDLGKGSFGQVKLVKDKADPKKLYALKIINKKELMAASSIDYLKREIKIQKKLDHPHIIRLYHYFEDKDNVYLILEYAKNGNLFFYLRRKKTLTEKEAFVYFLQTCIGIDYLHKKGILHRDLKPENLLLDATGNIKVCDFGWSAEDIGKRNTFCGTVDYMAPEMIQNQAHNFKIDIWSLGILLFELLHGHPPFQGKTANEKFQNILDKDLKIKDGFSNEVKDLLTSMLRSNPNERPGFDGIFNHPWILKHEKDFGMSVKSFIYDPSKKKDKSGKKTPEDLSPVSKTNITPTKETPPTKSPTSQAVGSANQIKTKPFNPEPSPGQTTLNVSVQSPKVENLQQTPQISQFDPKKVSSSYSPTPQIASSSTPIGEVSSRHSPSPAKGVNMAQELVQGISLPGQERTKSPSRGIFSESNKTLDNASKSPVVTPKEEKTISFPSSNPPARSNIAETSSSQETRSRKDKYANLYLDQTSSSADNSGLPEKNLTTQYQTNPATTSIYSTTSPSNVYASTSLPQETKVQTPKEQSNKVSVNEYSYTGNYGGAALQSNPIPIVSPSSQSKPYAHVQSHSETNLRAPQNTSDLYQKHGVAPGDIDFFVPKAGDIESTLIKLGSGSKAKSQPAYSGATTDISSFTTHNNFGLDQNDPVRMTRVTSLLQKNSFSDVDQIMEKFSNNGERSTNNYQAGEKNANDLVQKPQTPDHGRITNIDKYLANYQLENTEENMLLDKLDNYYSTGNLEADNTRYPKREQNEPKRDVQRAADTYTNKPTEAPRNVEVEKPQTMHQKVNSTELSFQDDGFQKLSFKKPLSRDPTFEMSFADMPRESEEFSVKNPSNYMKDEKKRDIYNHHIQEENEEDESVERKAIDQSGDKRNKPQQQKERQRREDAQANYNVPDQKRYEKVERVENPYKDQRQQAIGTKRREYEYQQEQELYRYQSSQEVPKKEQMPIYERREPEGKRREDASGFITRIVEQERRDVSANTNTNSNNLKLNQKVQSYEPKTTTEYVPKDLHRLENQREDVMKRYRTRLHGLYHFNSESGLSPQGKGQESPYGEPYGQYRDETNYNTFEREREGQLRGGYNDKVQSFHYQTDERHNPKRRKDDWSEEYDRRRQDESDYYSNKSLVQNYQSMDFTYEEMRRKRQELNHYTDDLDLEEETVSRPSWRNQREIPKNYQKYEQKKELSLIDKISALFGCLDRTEKQPKKARKGRRAY